MATVSAAEPVMATAAKFKSRSCRAQSEQLQQQQQQSERDNPPLDWPRYDHRVCLRQRSGQLVDDVVEAVDIELFVEESRSLIGANCQKGDGERERACKTVYHPAGFAKGLVKTAADRQRIASYANGQRRANSISEPSIENRTNSNGTISTTIDRNKKTELRADMTTQSFVPTDQQHQLSNAVALQEIEDQQFANARQLAHAAHPIGLNRPSSSCSLSSSEYEDDNAERQDREKPGDNDYGMISLCESNKNNIANSGNQAAEKYTVISSSSMMSLSDEHHYRQSYDRGGGGVGPLTASCSTNAINQSRSAAGGTKSMIGKLVGKKASRIRELVLQNLGRADRTTDDLFDLYEANFYKQQQQVLQLTKEFKLYTNALKSYHEASRSLGKSIQQSTSGYQLARHDLICDNLSQLDSLNEDLMEKLQEKVIKSLGDYLTRFHEIKDKINKRHRKLVDYDSSRRLYELMYARVSKKRSTNAQQQQPPQHNYQSILKGIKFLSQQQQQHQQHRPSAGGPHANQESGIASQLVDEARLLKLREQFNYSKLMYESINGELHEELPIVYESKMKSLLSALQNYYDIRAHHYSNAAKLVAKMSDVMCVGGNSASEDGHTILSMYADGTDKKSPRATNSLEEGSGSSGVSLSGSASRSSGSSLASPDCDDQHRRQTEHDGGQNESHEQAQESKNGDMPADLGISDRQFVGVSLESAGERDQEAAIDAIGDVAAVCEPDSVGSDGVEERIKSALGVGDVDGAASIGANSEGVQICATESPIEGQVESVVEGEIVGDDDMKSSVVGTDSNPDVGVDRVSLNDEQRNYLYRVRTNYKYLAEDVDELCFEANEIIQVIEFDENHEPEDGWLLGIREVNNQRGLFPANFTQPI